MMLFAFFLLGTATLGHAFKSATALGHGGSRTAPSGGVRAEYPPRTGLTFVDDSPSSTSFSNFEAAAPSTINSAAPPLLVPGPVVLDASSSNLAAPSPASSRSDNVYFENDTFGIQKHHAPTPKLQALALERQLATARLCNPKNPPPPTSRSP